MQVLSAAAGKLAMKLQHCVKESATQSLLQVHSPGVLYITTLQSNIHHQPTMTIATHRRVSNLMMANVILR